MKLFLLLIITFSFVLSKEFCISNFSKKLCKDFQISNGVIVKSKLDKNELKSKLNKDSIKQIAFLKNSYIYLIDSTEPIKTYNALKDLDFIEYVIPDIIQKNQKSQLFTESSKKNFDMRKRWSKSKGENIKIAVIDDGFDLEHEEFQTLNVVFEFDVDTKTLDAKPKSQFDTHGTQVAGIIFAQHDGKGIDGIAPKANFIAIRHTTNKTSDTILAFTIAKKAGADIINCSWNSPTLLEPIYDVIKYITKDTLVVFAAGNEHKEITPYSIEAGIPEVVTVGTTQKYSNYGSLVDFKISSGLITTQRKGGYIKFGGTSATAPVISGLLALELSQNQNEKLGNIISKLKKEIDEK